MRPLRHSRAACRPVAAANPDLERLAVRAERRLQPAGAQQREPDCGSLPLGRQGRAAATRRPPRRRSRRPPSGATRARKGPDGSPAQAPRWPRSRPHTRPGRPRASGPARRARSSATGATAALACTSPGRVGVVVVEDVSGAAGRRHAPGEAVSGRARCRAPAAAHAARRACEPVEERTAIPSPSVTARA